MIANDLRRVSPSVRYISIEVRIVRVHVDEHIRMTDYTDRIDPKRWRPLIMSFQQFFGLSDDTVHQSTLGEIPESAYRPPQVPRRVSA